MNKEEIPNAETIKEIEETRKGIGLYRVANIDELFKDLDGTEEGDKILGEAAMRIRKECKLISKEEFYKIVDM